MLPRALCVFFFATFLSGAAFDTFFFAALGGAAAEDFLGMFWTRRELRPQESTPTSSQQT